MIAAHEKFMASTVVTVADFTSHDIHLLKLNLVPEFKTWKKNLPEEPDMF